MEQGLPYFLRFVETFPKIQALANAEEKEVLRLWQGLGYYSRARNLHATAKLVANSLNGAFPSSYTEILKLKGIGPYTAAAISSICFDEPRPVVDGNVFRFASRYFGVEDDIAKTKTRKVFEDLLQEHISVEIPGAFNQAMMEYGSTVCSPSPNCDGCVFSDACIARMRGMERTLPVKTKNIKVRKRFFHYLVFYHGTSYLLRERDQRDVWAHLFDFPLIEGVFDEEDVLHQVEEIMGKDFLLEEVSIPFRHILSHQKIEAVFYRIKLGAARIKKTKGSLGSGLYSVEEIVNLPKPKLIVNYFQHIGIKS